MRLLLGLLCVAILLLMTFVTVQASLVRPVWDNGHLLQDHWFVATWCDAYCAFLLFFVWVASRERSWPARTAWLLAIMLLGNFAMAGYVLLQLARLGPDRPLGELLRPTAPK